jgi:ABC-type lipoprotein export system ATPase subunit
VSVLTLHSVVKHYAGPSEVVHAIDGVSLSIEAGQMFAIYGPSGSGKSTLLTIAAGLLAPDSGTVTFLGRDLASMSPGELADYQRADIGFIYQSTHLMPGVPAVENAAIKLLADRTGLKEARAAAVPWLERVGLGARLDHTPERLSGGERQRVAIARALINAPKLILADEPTGNLDSRRGLEILSMLAELSHERDTAILLATHDPQAAALADHVCTLRDGTLHLETQADGPRPPAPRTQDR